jgi:hypothetical protein
MQHSSVQQVPSPVKHELYSACSVVCKEVEHKLAVAEQHIMLLALVSLTIVSVRQALMHYKQQARSQQFAVITSNMLHTTF